MAEFVPGRELSRRYYEQVVRSILDEHFPGLAYSAGLIGPGSEVLGFDTELSTDHDWAPRVVLYLEQGVREEMAATIHDVMAWQLPFTFNGYATQLTPHPDDPGATTLEVASSRPMIHHQVLTANLQSFVQAYTGIDLDAGPSLWDWLLVPEQQLRSLAAGAVFHDGLGVLSQMQAQLAYYPDDVWRYLLAAQWQRIGEEEPFVGRAGSVGDEVGSAVIAARLARDLMRLCFLLEREYAPYAKWFGSAFAQLSCAAELGPLLEALLQAGNWRARERQLGQVYTIVARLHNRRQLTPPIPESVSPFFSRPFLVLHGGRIADAVWAQIEDEAIRALPRGVGKVDQFVDNVAMLTDPARLRRLRWVYTEDGLSRAR